MKKLLLTLLVALLTLSGNAKSLKELWASIPDSLLPYMDKAHRLEMTDFISMGLKGDVDNMLGSKSIMDSISNTYIELTLNEAYTIQIRKLQAADSDSILCVVRTWSAPEKESAVDFYDQEWKKIDKTVNLRGYISQLLAKPESMGQTDYDKLLGYVDFTMVRASLDPNEDVLTLSLSIPAEDKEKADKLKALAHEIVLRWNGDTFL